MTLQLPPFLLDTQPPSGLLLAVACPSCHAALAVPSELVGGPAQCPLCQASFLIPLPAAAPIPAAPAAAIAAPALVSLVSEGERLSAPDPAFASLDLHAVTPSATPQENSALAFQEPVKPIGSGSNTIELRSLTSEEKARRRARRNFITLVAGVLGLLAIVLLLGKKSRRK